MIDIKTHPSMNKEIKYILGQSESHTDQYAVARIVELEKALEFYANEDNWEEERIGSDYMADYTKPIDGDYGDVAKQALKESEGND